MAEFYPWEVFMCDTSGPDLVTGQVVAIVAEHFGVSELKIKRETRFAEDLDADSLDSVEVAMKFEDTFEISIPNEDVERIKTVGQAIDYLNEHQQK